MRVTVVVCNACSHLSLTHRLRISKTTSDDVTLIRIELRHNVASASEKQVEEMWSVLLPFLKEVELILNQYKGALRHTMHTLYKLKSRALAGARVVRHMECPLCTRASFLGEWQAPKDMQSSSVRECESCHKQVSTSFLIQPKEKKRGETVSKQTKMSHIQI